jgi:hypothetical protein
MKPSRRSRLGLHATYSFLGIVLALAAGCGNYSNEDLEFMNAMPAREDLSADVPARSALTQGMEAELAKATHDVSKTFNAMLFQILGGVDLIRSFQPSERAPNSRTWGPVPQDRVPGWRWHFVVTRDAQDPTTFTYALELQRNTDPGDVWVRFLNGTFTSTQGARRGVGSFTMQTDDLRAANYPNDVEGRKIKSLKVDYDTRDFPISLHVVLETYPDPDDPTVWVTTEFEYGVAADGKGAMRFAIMGNLDLTTAALETLTVTSRWMPTGEGRAEAKITFGDNVGLTEVQCWDRDFNPTFTNKPWPVSVDSPDPSPVGMESDCPQFP